MMNSFLERENSLSPYATKSVDGIRLYNLDDDFRPNFARDADRILNYNSYTRYLNKTQVFSFKKNDHVQTRIIHVTLVSKIARTIGRALNLNEDLIEAIALGHDIGHPPLGHLGERILDKISLRELNEHFFHNIESVRNYMELENKGDGANLTIQVLDGIMCHNGEILNNIYKPKDKSVNDFLTEYKNANKTDHFNLRPMTLEGCVVRVSDIISYVGRDLEDAITLNFIERKSLSDNIIHVLGDNNRDIVNSLVLDIINNSLNKPYIKFSDNVFKALKELIAFNYQNIYSKANDKETILYYEKVFNTLFDKYLNDLNTNNLESNIIKNYLNEMNTKYRNNTSNKRIVLDFIAGMTDEYLISCYEKIKIDF